VNPIHPKGHPELQEVEVSRRVEVFLSSCEFRVVLGCIQLVEEVSLVNPVQMKAFRRRGKLNVPEKGMALRV